MATIDKRVDNLERLSDKGACVANVVAQLPPPYQEWRRLSDGRAVRPDEYGTVRWDNPNGPVIVLDGLDGHFWACPAMRAWLDEWIAARKDE